MPDHAGSPCCRNAYGKQADDLQQCSEYGFPSGAVAAVHDIVAGTYRSGRQIDKDHIFAEKHRLRPKRSEERRVGKECAA